LPGIRRVTDKYSVIAAVYSGRTQEEIAYCQRCLEMANVRCKLGNRIYLPDESGNTVIPPDADKWHQCHKCGTIYPKYEAKQEAEVTSLTDPRDNPFKFGKGEVKTGESLMFDRTGRTQTKKKYKQDLEQYKEEDIKDAPASLPVIVSSPCSALMSFD
jgi:hypothetical protein